MKKTNTLLTALAIALTATAQTDVTKYYLTNHAFDEGFNYTKESTANVAEEVLDIPGWTADLSASYTIAGIYEIGFRGKYNTASVPATAYDGTATGGGLALSTGWSQTFKYYQTVTLPAGTYTLTVPTYNGSDRTAATSLVAWIPTSGTQKKSTLTSYPVGQWTVDKISFTLTKKTTGKIQIGMQAAAGGSVNSAKLFIDYVRLEGTDMAVDKTALEATIKSAQTLYADGTGRGAATLQQAIQTAQTTDDDTEASLIAVLDANSALQEAIAAYRQTQNSDSQLKAAIQTAQGFYGDGTGNEAAALLQAIETAQAVYDNQEADNAALQAATTALQEAVLAYRNRNISEQNPFDVTADYILNPSFEENGTEGWTNENMQSQTNTSFTRKAGTTYVEKWVGSGSVGSGSLSQVIQGLPNGIYRLTAAAQNLTQSSSAKKNTGAYIYAGDQQTVVQTPADYSVTFTSIAGQVEIGFRAENATGNWICVDNFRLYQVGYVDETAVIAELTRLQTEAVSLQTSMMSVTAATALQQQIDAANAIISGQQPYDGSVTLAIQAATAAAKVSIAEYQALADKIATVEKSYNPAKEGAADFLTALDRAKALAQNADATSDELADEILALDKALLAFNLANSTPGSGTAPRVSETNPYVATGATEALVRATMTGGNILERGVCWSTEHNPTVLDERTTKYFTLNGYIFHVKGLKPATVYYVRPYIMNKTYTVAYGDEVKIVTHPKGTCTGSWNEGAPTEEANARCRNAIKETIAYFNEWTGIQGFHLTGNYGAGTPTADCSYGGWMRIGPNAGNQAIGTVLHETGHGVGVGTQARWSDKNLHDWVWKGRETTDVYRFLENKAGNTEYVFVGDGMHGWGQNSTYDWLVNGADKDKHQEIQYIGGMCILHGMFIDGLCPTSANLNGISGYTYNFDDRKKYYIMNKDKERGLGNGLLYQRNSTAAGWKPMLQNEEVSDSAAWYMEFNPRLGYYMLKNALTGRYLTHAASGTNVTLKNTKSPTTTEHFQLMPDRTDVTLTGNGTTLTTHGYWFTWTTNGNIKAMGANAPSGSLQYGAIPQASFDFSDAATQQQWIIISEDELPTYQKILGVEPAKVTLDDIAAQIRQYTQGGSQTISTITRLIQKYTR